MNSLQSSTLRLHGSNAPPHSWTRSPVQCRYENHVIVCGIRHALHHAASRNDDPFQREGCHLRRRGERNRIRHHRLPAAALLAVWKVSHAMNPTKSAAPIPKIHRVALVDNDPRALESLSLLIEAKVPTAYVVWTATSGDEAIERCQRNDDNLNLLVLDMSMEGLQGPAICHRIRLMDRHLPILGITSFSINSYRSRLMEAGACASDARRRPHRGSPCARSKSSPCAPTACWTGRSPNDWTSPKAPCASICRAFSRS